MSAATTHTNITTNTAGVPPAPPEAHQRAGGEANSSKTVKVADFRDATDRLFRVANVDYHACVGAREFEAWKLIAGRVLEQVEGLECKRAKDYDREQFAQAVEATKARLVDADARIAKAAAGAQDREQRKSAVQRQALQKAVEGESTANYEAIFEGFMAMGIPEDEILPRENVFTFNAWKALGRVVKKEQHGVRIMTVIACTKKDEETGEETPVRKPKPTTVFHISQTKPLDGGHDEPHQEDSPQSAAEDADQADDELGDEDRPQNAYEARQEAKRARYEERAAAARAEGQATYSRARSMASVIPFGQPILVGHHSERRDRNYRAKIHNTFGKAFALQDKAQHYEQKAAAVGTGGISSDDPAAVAKLRKEVAQLEQAQERMKAANKAIRAKKTPEAQTAALVALGFTEAQAVKLLQPDFARRVGFPDYALSNNSANMRRIKARIAELEKRRARADVEEAADGYTYREDAEENRVMFVFPGKPEKSVRELLQSHGFRWSPSRDGKPWVRQLNNAGIWHARQVKDALSSARLPDKA